MQFCLQNFFNTISRIIVKKISISTCPCWMRAFRQVCAEWLQKYYARAKSTLSFSKSKAVAPVGPVGPFGPAPVEPDVKMKSAKLWICRKLLTLFCQLISLCRKSWRKRAANLLQHKIWRVFLWAAKIFGQLRHKLVWAQMPNRSCFIINIKMYQILWRLFWIQTENLLMMQIMCNCLTTG